MKLDRIAAIGLVVALAWGNQAFSAGPTNLSNAPPAADVHVSGQDANSSLPNAFFAFQDGTGGDRVPFDQQAKMLKELGYDGIEFESKPQRVPEMLKALDAQGLKMFCIYTMVNLDPAKPPYNPAVPAAIEQLQGRGTVISLFLPGVMPTTAQNDDRAVSIIRDIAAMAEKSGLRVALYPHWNTYVARVEDALRLVKKVDRKNVGTSFNLCHFLKADDEKNLELRLKEAMPHLFLVSINGADSGRTNDMNWDRLIQTLDRGSFDVGRVLKTLRQLGYTGPIGLQGYAIPGARRENLAHSMAAWRKLSAHAAAERPTQ